MTITISHRWSRDGFSSPPTSHVVEHWPDDMPLPMIGDRIDWPFPNDATARLRGYVRGRTFTEIGVLLFVEQCL